MVFCYNSPMDQDTTYNGLYEATPGFPSEDIVPAAESASVWLPWAVISPWKLPLAGKSYLAQEDSPWPMTGHWENVKTQNSPCNMRHLWRAIPASELHVEWAEAFVKTALQPSFSQCLILLPSLSQSLIPQISNRSISQTSSQNLLLEDLNLQHSLTPFQDCNPTRP